MRLTLNKLVLLSSLTVSLAACQMPADDNATSSTDMSQQEDAIIAHDAVQTTTDITEAVKKIQGAAVTVINKQKVTDIFGQIPSTHTESITDEELHEAGTGSGAVYKVSEGKAFIFTNNHVVEGSDAIDVLMKDGTLVPAEVIGADLYTDLAVLAIDDQYVADIAEFGDSDQLTLGEPAIAVGSPLGTEFALSVTSGVVSGLNRIVPVDTDNDHQLDWEMNVIQTDAAINPGNSGGPLVNAAGQVIGINSMKISAESTEGIGFAIPSNDAIRIINELEQAGEIARPVLGVSMIDLNFVTEEQKQQVLNIGDAIEEGVVIVDVKSGTSADEGGLVSGDVITAFNGEPVTTGLQLRQLVYKTRVGDEVDIQFYRDGKVMTETIIMQEQQGLRL